MTALAPVTRRPGSERPIVIAWLVVLALVGAAYFLFRAVLMVPATTAGLTGWSEPAPAAPYRLEELGLVFAMWAVVCSATMLPAATPAVLAFARVNRLYYAVRRPHLSTALFVLGFLAVWSGFGALATLLQWALHDAGALDASLAIPNATVAGLALVAAGVYQWTPAKHACLQHCREPMANILTGWRAGAWGAFRMGNTHGIDCIGCCWLLMLLLFAAGVTNLAAMVGLAALVLGEKVLRGGAWLACLSGLALLAWGTLLLFP